MAKFESKFSTNASMSPGFLLWKVSNLHQRLQRKALESLELTPSQFSVLACYFFLAMNSGAVSQVDVCNHAGIDKMLVSDLTKSLLKKRLIKSFKNKNDRRSFIIEVTDEGARVCNEALKIVEDLDSQFFGRLPKQSEFLGIMQVLAHQLP